MKLNTKTLLIAATTTAMIADSAQAAATVLDTSQTVGGTTTNLTLVPGNISTGHGSNVSVSTSVGGNLLVTVSNSPSNNDFYFNWSGAGDGLGFDASDYRYVQVDIAAVSAGLLSSNWEVFWTDNDSSIGGGSNSGTGLGAIDPTVGAPFSIVIDLVNGQSTGATGWGPGTVNNLRFDMFQSTSNAGESWEISAITFGSALVSVPEPSSAALLGLGGVALIFRRRK